MKVAVVTDSNSGITQEQAKELGCTVIPMPFLIDDSEYFEEINLSQDEFYEKLLGGADVSTSQPNIFGVVEVWKELLKTHDEVVHISMSSELSASTETAISYAKEFNGKVQVVDNHRISVTQKQSVVDAVNMAKDGKSAKEIKEWLEKTAKDSSIYIMLTTLKYLKKGGRITPAAAALGSLLKIKPVLQIQGGKLDKFCQVISYAQGKKKMIDQIVKDIENRFSEIQKEGKLKVFIAYTYLKDKAFEFKEEAEKELEKYGIEIEVVDPLSLSVACHIGDGAIALACATSYKK
jgi:DegV family protein with EDD domain